MKHVRLLSLVLLASLFGTISAQNPKTPMMGWSSWNTFRININETLIQETADAMISKGLYDAGYTFVNIDDGFFAGRGTDGKLINNDTKFPSGMRAISDYIHSKGLSAGIYSEAGDKTCAFYWDSDTKNGLNVGFYNYEEGDAKTFFDEWNFDFIKIDYCGAEYLGLDEQTQYTKIWNAIQKTDKVQNGGNVRMNICRWMFPGTWASEFAGSWRVSHDIRNTFTGTLGVIDVFKHNLYYSAYASPGHFNDMDMMQIGRNTFTVDQEKSHFGLWCIMNSPLMIGCDLRSIPDKTLEIITNKEVIALNQDVLGLQAEVISQEGDVFVLAKPIEVENGKVRGVALFNGTNAIKTIRVNFNDLQLSETAAVRDLWGQKNLGDYQAYYETTVPAYGIAMLRIEGESSFDKTTFEAENAFLNNYDGVKIDKGTYKDAIVSEKSGASGGHIISRLGNSANNWAEFRNIYSSEGGKYTLKIFYYASSKTGLNISVNGKEYTLSDLNMNNEYLRGRAFVRDIELQKGKNTIRLSNPNGAAPDIDKIVLLTPDEPEEDNEPDVDLTVIDNRHFPFLSTDDATDEHWYFIQFRTDKVVIQDTGEGRETSTSLKLTKTDTQLWKIVPTTDGYHLKNKSGRYLAYLNDIYTTSETTPVSVEILATANATHKPGWELRRSGTTRSIVQHSTDLNGAIRDSRTGVANAVLLFVAEEYEYNYAPSFSQEGNELWQYIYFTDNQLVLEDGGNGQKALLKKAEENKAAQLWAFIGDHQEFALKSQSGNYLNETNSEIHSSNNAAEALSFKLLLNENYIETPTWDIEALEKALSLSKVQFYLPHEIGTITSIEEIENKSNAIIAYGNTIRIGEEVKSAVVFSLVGVQIGIITAANNSFTIETPGCYIVKAVMNDNSTYSKVILIK